MNANEVLKLIDNGFTADEIRAMEVDEKPEDPKPEDPKPEGTKPEGTKPEGTKPDETLIELTNTVKELKNTVKEMQAANIDKAKGGKSDSMKATFDKIKSFTDTL